MNPVNKAALLSKIIKIKWMISALKAATFKGRILRRKKQMNKVKKTVLLRLKAEIHYNL
jgi:hypothetical protein